MLKSFHLKIRGTDYNRGRAEEDSFFISDSSSFSPSAVSRTRRSRYRVFFHFLPSLPHIFPSCSYSVEPTHRQPSDRCGISDDGVAVLCTICINSGGRKKEKKKVWTDNRRNQITVMSSAAARRLRRFVLFFFPFGEKRMFMNVSSCSGGAVWKLQIPKKKSHQRCRFTFSTDAGISTTFTKYKDTEQSTTTSYYFIQVLNSYVPVKSLKFWAVPLLLWPKPHLNIIAFSGESAHHLIESWNCARFGEVGVTQQGYSWHPSAVADILTRDRNISLHVEEIKLS